MLLCPWVVDTSVNGGGRMTLYKGNLRSTNDHSIWAASLWGSRRSWVSSDRPVLHLPCRAPSCREHSHTSPAVVPSAVQHLQTRRAGSDSRNTVRWLIPQILESSQAEGNLLIWDSPCKVTLALCVSRGLLSPGQSGIPE